MPSNLHIQEVKQGQARSSAKATDRDFLVQIIAKLRTLIFDALAISTVEGELHEGLSRQYEAVRVGIEGDSCFVKFTERVNMPHSGLSGRWARSVKANLHRADLKC